MAGTQLGQGALKQRSAEQLVISVPLSVAVQSSDKQVVPFKPINAPTHAPLGIFNHDHSFTQRNREMIQDRCLQQERQDRRRLA